MSKSPNNEIQKSVEDALEDVAHSLRKGAQGALELTDDTKALLSKAAADVTRAADSLRQQTTEATKKLAQKAAHEVQEHPIAALAAAITAAAALVGVIAATRRRNA